MDRARIQIGRLSRFGLLEMSRQRLRPSLESRATWYAALQWHWQHPQRGVPGAVDPAPDRRGRPQGAHFTHHVQVPVDVATYLMNEKRDWLRDMEDKTHTNIVLVRIRTSRRRNIPSAASRRRSGASGAQPGQLSDARGAGHRRSDTGSRQEAPAEAPAVATSCPNRRPVVAAPERVPAASPVHAPPGSGIGLWGRMKRFFVGSESSGAETRDAGPARAGRGDVRRDGRDHRDHRDHRDRDRGGARRGGGRGPYGDRAGARRDGNRSERAARAARVMSPTASQGVRRAARRAGAPRRPAQRGAPCRSRGATVRAQSHDGTRVNAVSAASFAPWRPAPARRRQSRGRDRAQQNPAQTVPARRARTVRPRTRHRQYQSTGEAGGGTPGNEPTMSWTSPHARGRQAQLNLVPSTPRRRRGTGCAPPAPATPPAATPEAAPTPPAAPAKVVWTSHRSRSPGTTTCATMSSRR